MNTTKELTMRQRETERAKAKTFFNKLSTHDRFELGDALVLGEFDWTEWLEKKPTSVFMNALDDARINWEITR